MKTTRTLLSSILLLVSLLTATAVLAHSDEYLDTQKTPNGGQMRMAGAYHFELVVAKDSQEVKDKPLQVYVTDHAGNKISTTGASGTATLLSGKSKAQVTLVPDGDNRLKGVGKYASSPDLKAVVSITIAGKPAEQARFTPSTAAAVLSSPAAAKDGHVGHSH